MRAGILFVADTTLPVAHGSLPHHHGLGRDRRPRARDIQGRFGALLLRHPLPVFGSEASLISRSQQWARFVFDLKLRLSLVTLVHAARHFFLNFELVEVAPRARMAKPSNGSFPSLASNTESRTAGTSFRMVIHNS